MSLVPIKPLRRDFTQALCIYLPHFDFVQRANMASLIDLSSFLGMRLRFPQLSVNGKLEAWVALESVQKEIDPSSPLFIQILTLRKRMRNQRKSLRPTYRRLLRRSP